MCNAEFRNQLKEALQEAKTQKVEESVLIVEKERQDPRKHPGRKAVLHKIGEDS